MTDLLQLYWSPGHVSQRFKLDYNPMQINASTIYRGIKNKALPLEVKSKLRKRPFPGQRMKGTSAVIVAAGQSSRMGAFKPMLPLGSTTLVRRGILTLLDAGIKDIVIVTGNNAGALQGHLQDLPVLCVYNPDFKTCEMIDSARLGFLSVSPACKRMFFLPVDVPLFLPQTLLKLCEAMQGGAGVVKPTFDGHSGHPILISSSLIPRIAAYEGSGGLAGALKEYGDPTMRLECSDPGILLDADTPEDYEKMKVYYESIYNK